MFITFEGGEGSGKTTQIQLLAKRLRERGKTVVTTREPGGTALAESIRQLVLGAKTQGIGVLAETLLFLAARADHLQQVIAPALARGEVVLCDRFMDSTFVYQGLARGLGLAQLQQLHEAAFAGLKPSITFVLDIPAEEGLKRTVIRADAPTRFDAMNLGFHKQVREGFLQLATAEPRRFRVIDALQAKENVAAAISAQIP